MDDITYECSDPGSKIGRMTAAIVLHIMDYCDTQEKQSVAAILEVAAYIKIIKAVMRTRHFPIAFSDIFKNVTSLDLCYNECETALNMPHLKYLSGGRISNEALDGCPNIIELKVLFNPHIKNVNCLPQLEYLESNHVTQFGISKCRKITSLYAYENRNLISVNHMKNLRCLSTRYIPQEGFADCVFLERLAISGNEHVCSVNFLPRLKELIWNSRRLMLGTYRCLSLRQKNE